jgi:Fur family ferric uptake transcriptional regulator
MQAACKTPILHGMARPSHVRDAVSQLVVTSDRHGWTLDEAHAALGAQGMDADPSSVFRALVHLSENGSLERVELGDGRARFERPGSHHEHIVCSDCGQVAEVPGCLIDSAVPEVERRTGFSVTGHNLTFSGRCQDCSGTA